jgi:hypothetical protein
MLLSIQYLCAQETKGITYRIMTVPTQYVFNEYNLAVERVFKRNTLGLEFGFRPSTQRSGEAQSGGRGMWFGDYSNQNFVNKLYNGVTFGVNSKYYLSSQNKRYIEAVVFYRYWWFNDKNCYYNNVEGYRFNGTRTESQNIFGIKLLFGRSFQLRTSFKLKPIMDLYCGVGVRYKSCVFETDNGTVGDMYYSYKQDLLQYWIPSIQGGIKLGFGL